jgi:hypothetical protein
MPSLFILGDAMTKKWIVCGGNLIDGHEFYGQFGSHEQAQEWGQKNFDVTGFHIAVMHPILNIEKMTDGEWIAYREEKLHDYFASGKELVPDPECKQCDTHNDYVCFYCELHQIGE